MRAFDAVLSHASAVTPSLPLSLPLCEPFPPTLPLSLLLTLSHSHSLSLPLSHTPLTHPQATFEDCFAKQYTIIHRLETNKLRNVAKLFAHLLAADAISWGVLSAIRLTEDDTTSSSRIFIKYLFQVRGGG